MTMLHFSLLRHCLQTIWINILNYLFPKDATLQIIESMTVQEWHAKQTITRACTENVHIVSLFTFTDPLMQRLIHAIKYEKNRQAIIVAAHQLADYITQHIPHTTTQHYVLCPVPQSKRRYRERGYNQCELLTAQISKQLPKLTYLPHLLTKTRHTKSQTTKRKQERLQNLQNSIDYNKKYHANLTTETVIIVIDDVYTTGATQTEVVRALQTVPHAVLYFITIGRV